MEIDLVEGARPHRDAPRRLPPDRELVVDGIIAELLTARVISKSKSPWASPIVLAKKPDGSWRFCVDMRRLNSITLRDAYPLPRIDAILDMLSGNKWFSTLDLAAGYWQLPLSADARPKTAFITKKGLYEFNVVPFGLTNAPGFFQRFMHEALRGLHGSICDVYMDDIIIFSKTFE